METTALKHIENLKELRDKAFNHGEYDLVEKLTKMIANCEWSIIINKVFDNE